MWYYNYPWAVLLRGRGKIVEHFPEASAWRSFRPEILAWGVFVGSVYSCMILSIVCHSSGDEYISQYTTQHLNYIQAWNNPNRSFFAMLTKDLSLNFSEVFRSFPKFFEVVFRSFSISFSFARWRSVNLSSVARLRPLSSGTKCSWFIST